MSYRDQVEARARNAWQQADQNLAKTKTTPERGKETLKEALVHAGCPTMTLPSGVQALAGLELDTGEDACPFPSRTIAEEEAVALAFPSGTMPCDGKCGAPDRLTTTITGRVTSAARGSFTRSGIEQVVLLVSGQGDLLPICCNCRNTQNKLLVFEGGALLQALSFPDFGYQGTSITKAVDVNLDGVAELLLQTTTTWDGVSINARLAKLLSGELAWLGPRDGWSLLTRTWDLDKEAERSSCRVLYASPGPSPALSLRPRRGGCG
jgi:hypothetical protein